MNVLDLELLFAMNPYTLRMYRGTFPVDRVSPLKEDGFMVINTHPHDGPGEHWLLYYYDNIRGYVYCDSFGLPPIEEQLQDLPIDQYNDTCIQSLYSSNCGLYVCVIASKLCKNHSLKSIVSLFDNNLVHNDLKIIKMTEEEYLY